MVAPSGENCGGLGADARGQARSLAARARDDPEIAGVDKDDVRPVHRRLMQEQFVALRECRHACQ
jgi:hypothetical protein